MFYQQGDRIIALIDMDCFYVQVEQRLEPKTWGTPCVVEQYQGGRTIAVNYEARDLGMKRFFRVQECKDICPGVRIFKVPIVNEKGDLTKYRTASNEVFEVIFKFDDKIIVERASVDEAYLDLTEVSLSEEAVTKYGDTDISEVAIAGTKESIGGSSQLVDDPLIIGAKIIKKLRQEIKEKTQFNCSAGVSFNKFLAKIACTVRKPNGQSILSRSCVPSVFCDLPLDKVRNLGGKLGQEIKQCYEIETMKELSEISLESLTASLGSKTGQWVYEVAKGNDNEPVTSRNKNKSIGCGKNFAGLRTVSEVKKWIENLSGELLNRLEEDKLVNQRQATSLVVNVRFPSDSFSKSLSLSLYDRKLVAEDVMKSVISKLPISSDGDMKMKITSLSLSTHKFIELDKASALINTPRIQSFFKKSTNCPPEEKSEPPVAPILINEDSSSNEVVILDDAPTSTPSFSFNDQKGFFYRKTRELLLSKVINHH